MHRSAQNYGVRASGSGPQEGRALALNPEPKQFAKESKCLRHRLRAPLSKGGADQDSKLAELVRSFTEAGEALLYFAGKCRA